mmetsp:Transcript_30165/g.73414  ORF Transcript_30165/g.73414 Transcript_30165/m.73414 type:complete len:210 (+) Transcript_30165:1065-1694(+)
MSILRAIVTPETILNKFYTYDAKINKNPSIYKKIISLNKTNQKFYKNKNLINLIGKNRMKINIKNNTKFIISFHDTINNYYKKNNADKFKNLFHTNMNFYNLSKINFSKIIIEADMMKYFFVKFIKHFSYLIKKNSYIKCIKKNEKDTFNKSCLLQPGLVNFYLSEGSIFFNNNQTIIAGIRMKGIVDISPKVLNKKVEEKNTASIRVK